MLTGLDLAILTLNVERYIICGANESLLIYTLED
jgi:hypothetical protein